MRRSKLRRRLIGAAVLVHFVILGLNSLPGSRFVQALFPYYGWYPRWTGQNQVWAMYQYPDRQSNVFEVVARFDDGHEAPAWGGSRGLSSRQMYFVEALFFREDNNHLAHRFLDVLRQRWPSTAKPRALSVRRRSVAINNYATVPLKGVYGEASERKIERRW